MEIELLKEVLECLAEDRRLVHYHDDKYALYLLQQYCKQHEKKSPSKIKIGQIKTSAFAKCLHRPKVKKLVASFGDGKISSKRLAQAVIDDYQSYVITLSQWGCKEDYEWAQTSVPGANLVMQLNLTNQHDQYLLDLKLNGEPFKYHSHPIHHSKSSLSWARIDFDLNTGEALIEEIQNDWLRRAARHTVWAKAAITNSRKYYWIRGEKYAAKQMLEYTQVLLARYQKRWQETTLFYAIKLINQDIGINKIFYHSLETGAVLKDIRGTLPPRSLYTSLPKRFCFSPCDNGPEFIMSNRKVKRKLKKIKKIEWFQLNL